VRKQTKQPEFILKSLHRLILLTNKWAKKHVKYFKKIILNEFEREFVFVNDEVILNNKVFK